MNSRVLFLCAAALLLVDCAQSPDISIPTFPNGGLLRTGTPLQRAQLLAFEGMFDVPSGSDLFGESAAVRTSPGTVSVLTDRHAGFAVLGAACLSDQRVVVEGYWQYPVDAETGLVRLFVEPNDVAAALCSGEAPAPTTDLRLTGSYGNGSDLPAIPLTLAWSHALKPWRGTFYTVGHQGACEVADDCGATPNSVESVRLAERTGANAVEVDVRLTRDGVPILFHDPSLSSSLVKGLFCNGKIEDLSLAELRASCQLREGETLPTVEEMLDAAIDETELEGVYLDVKVPEAVLPVSRVASRLGAKLAERNSTAAPNDARRFAIVVGLPNQEQLDAWHAAKATLAKDGLAIPPCLIEFDPDVVISEGCGAWGATWTQGPQVDNVHKVQAAGALTLFWTINQSDFIDAFLEKAHPNGIITARSALLFSRYQAIGTPPPPRTPGGAAQ